MEERVKVNAKFKDRLFRLLFGAEENKQYLLQLYNAVNDTDYTDVNALQMTTIDDAIYMHMKNDSSFIIASEMDLYEHQSTYNPNMPLRGFLYFGHLYEKYVKNTGKNVYGRELIEIPTPRYVVFYNGTDEMPDETVLRLSDAFMKPDDTGGYEWTARMLNINKGHNRKLMEKCRPLKEYSDLIYLTRRYQKEMEDKKAAIDKAVKEAETWECLGAYLTNHRNEVIDVLLTEYDELLHENQCREEGRRE